MPKTTQLDKQWDQLISLCERESSFRREGGHPRLVKLLASAIDQLASQMGFSAKRIATRDFRAQREGTRIVGISTE